MGKEKVAKKRSRAIFEEMLAQILIVLEGSEEGKTVSCKVDQASKVPIRSAALGILLKKERTNYQPWKDGQYPPISEKGLY